MVMKTEMADRPVRVRSGNSERISAKDYSHVERQEFNLNLHNTTWRWHATSAKVHAAFFFLVRDRSVLIYSENNIGIYA